MPFGVDEAGKGPVLGSMFAAAVWVADESVLPDGVADSKTLAPDRRETLAAELRAAEAVRIGVAEIPPRRIDDPDTDMNGLAVAAHAESIDAALENVLAEGAVAEESALEDRTAAPSENQAANATGLCDACDTDAERFARRVADACETPVDVAARHGADDESALVGAASVIAKVERDAHVAAIADEYGDVGSGYPSDPTTREFLESYVAAHGDLPPVARETWSTCEDVLAAAEQTGLSEF